MEERQIPLTEKENEKDEKSRKEAMREEVRGEMPDAVEADAGSRIREEGMRENGTENGTENGIENGRNRIGNGIENERSNGIENGIGKKKDRILLELSVGIVMWGVLCQLTIVWFVSDKAGYSLGLWLGTFLAVAAGVHMWWALDRALDFERDTAVKMMTKHNIIRYVAIVAVMALIMVSGCANPLAAFLGLMGLKVAAYLQPFTHKVLGYINN